MHRQQHMPSPGKARLSILAAAIACALCACSSAPLSREARVSCGNSLQRDFTAPFHPGMSCLEVSDLGGVPSAARLQTAMKAVSRDGRVFFVPQPPTALAQAPVGHIEVRP